MKEMIIDFHLELLIICPGTGRRPHIEASNGIYKDEVAKDIECNGIWVSTQILGFYSFEKRT